MPTWCLTVAWDGTDFVGWQRQISGRSVEDTLRAALTRHLDGPPVKLVATGRTDAGVHAAAQVVSFQTDVEREPRNLIAGLNTALPRDLAVIDARIAPEGFNARSWAERKLYRFRILRREARCPLRERFVVHHRYPLDVPAMAHAAREIEGRHDFSSFRASGCSATHPVRIVESAVVREVDDEVHFDFIGHGFLRYQVRIMVGTLLPIGRGKPVRIGDVLAARDRRAAGPTAPAQGLCLQWVELRDAPRDGSLRPAGALDVEGEGEAEDG